MALIKRCPKCGSRDTFRMDWKKNYKCRKCLHKWVARR